MDELENVLFLQGYDGYSNQIFMNHLNQTLSIKCFQNADILNNETFKYCYREFKFILFGFDTLKLNYEPIGSIELPELFTNSQISELNAIINMTNNYTFQFDESEEILIIQKSENFKIIFLRIF